MYPGSPAEQAEIEAGSILKLVGGQEITGLDTEEVYELTSRFEGKAKLVLKNKSADCVRACALAGSVLHVTIRLPDEPDTTRLRTRIVWFHHPPSEDYERVPTFLEKVWNLVVHGQEMGIAYYEKRWEEQEEISKKRHTLRSSCSSSTNSRSTTVSSSDLTTDSMSLNNQGVK